MQQLSFFGSVLDVNKYRAISSMHANTFVNTKEKKKLKLSEMNEIKDAEPINGMNVTQLTAHRIVIGFRCGFLDGELCAAHEI